MNRNFLFCMLLVLLSSCGLGRDAAINRANTLFRDGYAQNALALYMKADSTDNALLSFNIANVLMYLGEDEAAEAMYKNAIQKGAKDIQARAYYNLGVSAYKTAKFKEASAFFKKGILVFGTVPPRNKTEAGLRKELSLVYEQAMAADKNRQKNQSIERSKAVQADSDGQESPFSISSSFNKTLFEPSVLEASPLEDH